VGVMEYTYEGRTMKELLSLNKVTKRFGGLNANQDCQRR